MSDTPKSAYVDMSFQSLDRQVKALIHQVGRQIILPTFGHLGADDIFSKSLDDQVTIVDQQTEAFLTENLSHLLPESSVIGEEAAANHPELLSLLTEDRFIWVVDPLDGTKNYIQGQSDFAVIVALVKEDQILAGWIYDVLQEQFAWAFKGQGCWYNDTQIMISTQQDNSIGKLSGSVPYPLRQNWQKEDPMTLPVIVKQSLSCAGKDYLRLLAGKLDFVTFRRSNPWDHAAGALLYHEAGGVVYNWALTQSYQPSQRTGGIIAAASLESLKKLSRLLNF